MEKLVSPPKESPEIEYLSDMYDDGLFPNFLVDKVRAELSSIVDFLMASVRSYEEVQQELDNCVSAINSIADEFYEYDSEFETVARNSIGATMSVILKRFDITIDIETAIRKRNW